MRFGRSFRCRTSCGVRRGPGPLRTERYGTASHPNELGVGPPSVFSLVEMVRVQTVVGTFLASWPAGDLGHLLSLLAAGRLDPQIGWQGSWSRAAEAVEALRGRRVAGKAVLEID